MEAASGEDCRLTWLNETICDSSVLVDEKSSRMCAELWQIIRIAKPGPGDVKQKL